MAPIGMPEWSNGDRFDAAAILSREVELLFLLAGRERCNLFKAPPFGGRALRLLPCVREGKSSSLLFGLEFLVSGWAGGRHARIGAPCGDCYPVQQIGQLKSTRPTVNERRQIMNGNNWHCLRVIQAAIAVSMVIGAATAALAESPKIVQIEEYWELAVGEPDAQLSAPQATMVMSPNEDLNGQYFVFTLNHRSVPSYEPGGMQVQLWNGNDAVDAESSSASTLNSSGDVIQWVQRLKVEDGSLSFEIVEGSSNSWGSFGGDGSLAFSTPTSLENLNGYRPAISLGESQVGYAGNRVQRLLLKKLVWHTDDGETHELHAPIDIDADLDP